MKSIRWTPDQLEAWKRTYRPFENDKPKTEPKKDIYIELPPDHSGMNKTEAKYARYLESQKQSGIIDSYFFECFKFKVADGTCWYTPDFLVFRITDNGLKLEIHEVKGSEKIFFDDAKVKTKVTATKYKIPILIVTPSKDGWHTRNILENKKKPQ